MSSQTHPLEDELAGLESARAALDEQITRTEKALAALKGMGLMEWRKARRIARAEAAIPVEPGPIVGRCACGVEVRAADLVEGLHPHGEGRPPGRVEMAGGEA